MRTRSITWCVIVVSLFLGCIQETFGIKIEEAQRAFQDRHKAAFGTLTSWPVRQSDNVQPPAYPPDGFYEDDLQVASRAVSLVGDLANRLNNNSLLNQFVSVPDGNIEGLTTVPVFSTDSTSMPPVIGITTENYVEKFAVVTGYICKLKCLRVTATVANGASRDGGNQFGAGGGCAGAQALADQNWLNRSWVGSGAAIEMFEGGVGISPTSALVNKHSNRGTINADLSGMSGSAICYLRVTAFSGGVSNDPPVLSDNTWHTFMPASPGGQWQSPMLADRAPVFTHNCPGGNGISKGWQITSRIVIVTPTFENNIEDCDGCNTCQNCPPGAGDGTQTSNSSVDVRIGLGKAKFGRTAGNLLITAETPNAFLATRSILKPLGLNGTQVIMDTNGVRQVKTATALADVVTVDPFTYDVRFYTLPNAGSTNSAGIYQPVGAPYSTVTIQNPDGTNSVNRLRVTQTIDSSSKISDFEYFPAENRWDLAKGSGARVDSRTKVWNGAIRTETYVVKDGNSQVVTKRTEKFQVFPWGEEKIQQVDDPDGAALTTTWSFYSNSSQDGVNYGRLKSVVQPHGYWEVYQYDQHGRNIKTVAQYLDAPIGSPDSACRVTTTTYADTDPAVAVVETVLGQEVSRRYVVDRPGERRDIRCSTVGAAWNDSNNLVTVEKRNLGGLFEGELKSVKNPDGTMSLCEYSSDGFYKTTTVSTGQPNAGESAIVDGTRVVTVVDVAGNVFSEESYDIASSLLLSSAIATQTDDFGRATRIEYNDGTFITRVYGCCGLESETDREGIITTFAYDDLRQLILQTRAGISTIYTYDADGRILKTIRKGTDNSEITTEESTYDLAGRRTSSKDAINHVTGFAETVDINGHTVKTTTYPGSSTRIETSAQDGSLLEISGTAAHPLKFEYGTEATGTFAKEIRVGAGGSQTEWIKTSTDLLGRGFKTTFADGAVQQSFYNTKGQLTKQVDPDGVAILFAYNLRGEQEVSAVDVNRNGVIDYAGLDRITKSVGDVVSAHATTVRRTTTSVWATDNADSPSVASVQEISADGLQSWNTALSLTAHSQTLLDGTGGRNVTVTEPDASTTTSQFQDGRLTSVIRRDSSNNQVSATTYAYDPHGRQATVTDARNGPTTLTYNDLDQVTSVTTSGQTTSYAYDDLGRRTLTTLPDNGTVTSEYFDTGELKKTFGVRTYTTEYTYDPQGRMKTLLAGSGTTTWNYTSQRGFLDSKIYADGKGTAYTYTPAGRLQSRTWARGVGTAYTYNNAGDLGVIDYSDATADVAQNYDRLGRLANVSDAVGARTLSYNLLNRVLNETYAGGPLSGTQIQRTYALNRLATLTASGSSFNLPVAGYSYDGASRLENVTDGTHTATHAYHPNSSLVASITFKTGSDTKLTTTKSFDNLNRLTSITNTPVNDTPRSFAYTYNDANQRTRVDLADGSYWIYAYDTFGQVISGKKYFSDNTPVSGQQFDYAFDGIGNRTGTTTNGRNATYTANNLNQYTERQVPGAFDVLGTAESDAIVTVNNQPTTRHGDYFYRELSINNVALPKFEDIWVVGVKNLVGPNGEDAVTQDMGKAYLPKTPEIFTYDDDGNLLSDGRWNYTWNAENRLIAMQAISSAPAAAKKKLEFTYDSQGRRISKKVYNWNSGSSSYQLQATSYCVYDAWNKIAELNGSGSLVSSHVWGNDLSGSMQGAGGVGGLLFSADDAFAYDGNGNVTSLTDMSSGTLSGEYEYSPFGETVRATAAVAENRFGFSTKFADAETGLVYYGYRYLKSNTGRWLNRDPIGEKGGANVYALVKNTPLLLFDPLGQRSIEVEFNAFIPGRLGTWLPEPFSKEWEFKTDERSFGGGSDRIVGTLRFDSKKIGELEKSFVRFEVSGSGSVRRKVSDPSIVEFAAEMNSGVKVVKDIGPCESEVLMVLNGPYAFHPQLSPDINIRVTWTFKVVGQNRVGVSVEPAHDAFPNYEGLVDHAALYTFDTADKGPDIFNLNTFKLYPGLGRVIDADTK